MGIEMRRHRAIALACALGPMTVMAACNDLCDTNAAAALRVHIVDEAGAAVCDATVVVRDGSFAETLGRAGEPRPACLVAGSYERRGTYTVEVVTASGATGSTSGVRVSADRCHVIPVDVTVVART